MGADVITFTRTAEEDMTFSPRPGSPEVLANTPRLRYGPKREAILRKLIASHLPMRASDLVTSPIAQQHLRLMVRTGYVDRYESRRFPKRVDIGYVITAKGRELFFSWAAGERDLPRRPPDPNAPPRRHSYKATGCRLCDHTNTPPDYRTGGVGCAHASQRGVMKYTLPEPDARYTGAVADTTVPIFARRDYAIKVSHNLREVSLAGLRIEWPERTMIAECSDHPGGVTHRRARAQEHLMTGEHTCGIYAAMANSPTPHGPYGPTSAMAIVLLEGVVVEGTQGYRAERATIQSLRVSPLMADWVITELHERYQVPVLYKDNPWT